MPIWLGVCGKAPKETHLLRLCLLVAKLSNIIGVQPVQFCSQGFYIKKLDRTTGVVTSVPSLAGSVGVERVQTYFAREILLALPDYKSELVGSQIQTVCLSNQLVSFPYSALAVLLLIFLNF